LALIQIVQSQHVLSPKMVPQWDIHYVRPRRRVLSYDLILAKNGSSAVITVPYSTRRYLEISKAGKLPVASLGFIPRDLVPETVAISVTGLFSLLGMLIFEWFSVGPSTVFLAPLITSAFGMLFLWQAIRRRS